LEIFTVDENVDDGITTWEGSLDNDWYQESYFSSDSMSTLNYIKDVKYRYVDHKCCNITTFLWCWKN